jgi:hypothetical protein
MHKVPPVPPPAVVRNPQEKTTPAQVPAARKTDHDLNPTSTSPPLHTGTPPMARTATPSPRSPSTLGVHTFACRHFSAASSASSSKCSNPTTTASTTRCAPGSMYVPSLNSHHPPTPPPQTRPALDDFKTLCPTRIRPFTARRETWVFPPHAANRSPDRPARAGNLSFSATASPVPPPPLSLYHSTIYTNPYRPIPNHTAHPYSALYFV